MKLAEFSEPQLREALCGEGLVVRTGPFRFRIVSRTQEVLRGLRRLYADFEASTEGYCDYLVGVERVRGLRSHVRAQVNFHLDEFEPFAPLPANHAYALLEWGLNWSMAARAHHYLLIHAAVLERNGQSIILPGDPGAGKSTLTAALMLSGYRLLSDEMTLIDRHTGLIWPLARPVSLKNESIDIVRNRWPDTVFSDIAHDTHKGSVGHLMPSTASVQSIDRTGTATWLIFPRWERGADLTLSSCAKSEAFMRTAKHAFNYELLGATGFELLADLIDRCSCHDLRYSRLDDALAMFDDLTQ